MSPGKSWVGAATTTADSDDPSDPDEPAAGMHVLFASVSFLSVYKIDAVFNPSVNRCYS